MGCGRQWEYQCDRDDQHHRHHGRRRRRGAGAQGDADQSKVKAQIIVFSAGRPALLTTQRQDESQGDFRSAGCGRGRGDHYVRVCRGISQIDEMNDKC